MVGTDLCGAKSRVISNVHVEDQSMLCMQNLSVLTKATHSSSHTNPDMIFCKYCGICIIDKNVSAIQRCMETLLACL